MRRGRPVLSSLSLLLALSVAPAWAEAPDATVVRLARRGAAAYQRAHYREAATLLGRAYALRPLTSLVYNLARAHDKLGEVERSCEEYRRYIASADADPALLRRAQQRLAALAPRGRSRSPATPAPARPELQPEPSFAPPAARTGAAASSAPAAPTGAAVSAAPPPFGAPDLPPRRGPLLLAIAGAAAGLGAVGAGVGLWALASGHRADFAATRDEVRKRDLRDGAEALGLASSVLYGAGGLLLAASGCLLYVALRPARAAAPAHASATPSLVPWLAPATVGGAATWRF